MKFRKQVFGGNRPICTVSPAVGVIGGFNLDITKVKINPGDIIPAASLCEYNEAARTVVVLKASRVVAINPEDPKKVTLECNQFLRPIFVVNDSVLPKATGNFSDAPTIKSIQITKSGCVIELSSEISSLKVGDALFQVIEGEGGKAVYPVTTPQGLSIGAEPLGTTVSHFETSLDVTTDSKGGYFYTRRIPPLPEEFKEGHLLKTNPNIQFTDSL